MSFVFQAVTINASLIAMYNTLYEVHHKIMRHFSVCKSYQLIVLPKVNVFFPFINSTIKP